MPFIVPIEAEHTLVLVHTAREEQLEAYANRNAPHSLSHAS